MEAASTMAGLTWEWITREWWLSVIDILLVAIILYELFMVIQRTRAQQLLQGVIVVLVVWFFTQRTPLYTFNWLVSSIVTPVGGLALILLFLPEIRLWLEQLGKGEILYRRPTETRPMTVPALVDELIAAVHTLSVRKIGTLMVLERQTGLNDIISTGRELGARVSAELLSTIFFPNTPLHDGAVVLRGSEVAAAGCLLPLTERRDISPTIGTRHRAAIGLTEKTDAVVIVVSEETGTISLAYGGNLFSDLTEEVLKERLLALLEPVRPSGWAFWRG
jgi:diadenylate cyclase